MATIQQNGDGTYSSSYSDFELALFQQLKTEQETRLLVDQELWAVTTTLGNQIDALEQRQYGISDLQNLITQNIIRLDDHQTRLINLENAVVIDAYRREQTDQLAVEWKIEQIAHTFDIPANHMFDQANLDDILTGYKHYHGANINEPQDNHIPENTMQRYTISAYASKPKIATFNIQYADRLVVVVDDEIKATYIDANGNFNQVPKRLVIDLKEGWTKIQFLLSNETQYGGLVVMSDLYKQADYLSCLDYFAGMLMGNRIQSGSLEERHFSPNMDLSVHTLHATATDVPGVIIGNPDEQGILQIGDGTLSKAKDEPFVFSDGIRVNGFIRISQLLIDRDFIRAGDGMIVKTIKDQYGYTQMYEIINDMRLINGGALIITGNGQTGFTIANDLKLQVNEEGGLEVEGDAIHGYLVTNTMSLDSLGGMDVTGDPRHGYHVKNTMKLTSDYGIIKVVGDAVTGYTLKNVLQILEGGGIDIQGTVNEGLLTIYNDMKLTSDPGIIRVTGDPRNGYKLENVLQILAGGGISLLGSVNSGSVTVVNNMSLVSDGGLSVSGDARSGYRIANSMSLSAGTGISVSGNAIGGYTVRNTGITDVSAGNGISVSKSGGMATVKNTGVIDLIAGSGISVTETSDGTFRIQNTDGGSAVDVPSAPSLESVVFATVLPWYRGVYAESHPTKKTFQYTTNRNTHTVTTYMFGLIPPGANRVCAAVIGGHFGSPDTAFIEVNLEVDNLHSGGPSSNVMSQGKTLSIGSVVGSAGGGLNDYNFTKVVFNVGESDVWRHYYCMCLVTSSTGAGAGGQIAQMWSEDNSSPLRSFF